MFVRLALEDDEDVFVELARAGAEESLRDLGFDDYKVRETFHRYLDRANPTIFVVDDRRDVIGFLLATMNSYRFTQGLYTVQEVIFVRRDRRGSRAAALLLGELVRWSERLGAKEILGGNDNSFHSERTARLLKRFGFEQVGFFMRRVGNGWRR